MQSYILNHLAQILHTGIYYRHKNEFTVYEENAEYNPIYKDEHLRAKLLRGANAQEEPYIFMDGYLVFFVCVKRDAGQDESLGDDGMEYFLMGPLCTKSMGRVERHHFYRAYGVDEAWEKGLYYHTLMEVFLFGRNRGHAGNQRKLFVAVV
jgi:hypothetical protein